MHHCLEIYEILNIVFEFVETTESLAALARTCRTFSELALDVLWGWHGSLSALERLMPMKKFVSRSRANRERVWRLTRPLEPSDWERFRKYSNRIRIIPIIPDILESFKLLRNNAPPGVISFSRIRTLICSCDFAEETNLVPVFLSDELTTLILTIRWYAEDTIQNLSSIFTDVIKKSRHLKCLKVSLPTHITVPPEISKLISSLICHYHAWERLHLTGISLTSDCVRHIVQLPNLRTLMWSPESSCLPPVTKNHGFVRLTDYRHFETLKPDDDSVETFLSAISLVHPQARLTKIGLIILRTSTPTHIALALSLISLHCCHDTLITITFDQSLRPFNRRTSIPLVEHYVHLSFDALKPLLSFRNIQRLVLSGDNTSYRANCAFELDDNTFQEMVNAWPSLIELRIETKGYKITVKGFLSIFKGCPKLEKIQFTANFNGAYAWDHTELGSYPLIRDLNINVRDSLLSDEDIVGRLFISSFPNLTRVEYDPLGSCSEGWDWINYRISRYRRQKLGKTLSCCISLL